MNSSSSASNAGRAVWGRLRGGYRGMPLRVKLVVISLLLVIAALVGSGAVGAATLRSYLVGRVDSQLHGAQQSIVEHGVTSLDAAPPPGDGNHGRPGGDDHAHLPSEFVVALVDSKGVLAYGPASELANSAEALPKLPHPTGAETRAAGTHTFTVNSATDDAQWRVLAAPYSMPDGSTGTVLIAESLGQVNGTVEHVVLMSLLIGSVAVVLLAGVGYLVVRASLRPLRAVERTAADIAAGDLSHRVPEADPRTEVGQLAGALNTMLGDIESAFAARAASEGRLRRFVADASHELRTPLTSIRGFAELYRQGAVQEQDELDRLMRRIEDEAKRMGVLVEDLLLLARLDQERPLARAPVDLLAVATDAVHDAGAVDPDRPITLHVGSTDPPPVVTGDEVRLRQVVGNLMTNALKHTPAGTPVAVRIGTEEAAGAFRVVLEVADEGPGMPADVAEHVFERFYRADEARRADGSTGLGLAIAAALVAGHGGRISVRTAPGAGATFRVELPAADASA